MNKVILFVILVFMTAYADAQEREINSFKKYTTWALVQLVPSPVILGDDKGTRWALRWQATPVSYSFGANKFQSPWQFFFINPVRRNAGSVEFSLNPEWPLSDYKGSRFVMTAVVRAYFPVFHYGEYLNLSVGYRKRYYSRTGDEGIEGGAYIFGGIIGVRAGWNFRKDWDAGVNVRYY